MIDFSGESNHRVAELPSFETTGSVRVAPLPQPSMCRTLPRSPQLMLMLRVGVVCEWMVVLGKCSETTLSSRLACLDIAAMH